MAAAVLDLAGAQPFRVALEGYYRGKDNPLLWVGTGRGRALISQIENAETEGLSPSNYPLTTLSRLLPVLKDGEDITAIAVAELQFSAAFLRYASDLKVGRLSPRELDPELFVQTKTIDGATTLALLARAPDISTFFDAWAPQNQGYRALRGLLSAYRRLASSDGWGRVTTGVTLRAGDRDSRVEALRTRLETSGDATDTADERALFDSGLTRAVVRFQERHGLEPDGLVGPQTLAELNVPIEERIRQIILNMERWRWFPEDLGERYILVNIAGFELTVVEGTDVVERMPVIVGQPYRRTPVFSDVIRYLEFNPFWNVPYSIATIDKLPQLQSNPGALEAIGFEAFRDGVQVPISNVQWAGFTPRNFPYTLRQRPGPENALGQVKFMFPNQFHVYLHDTPTRGLFSRSARAFSSGCIRLARPLDLAAWVLADQPEGSRIDEILAAGKTTVVSLRTPLPVHLTYFTAWSEEDGTVQFRPDIYGRDKSLYESLFSSR